MIQHSYHPIDISKDELEKAASYVEFEKIFGSHYNNFKYVLEELQSRNVDPAVNFSRVSKLVLNKDKSGIVNKSEIQVVTESLQKNDFPVSESIVGTVLDSCPNIGSVFYNVFTQQAKNPAVLDITTPEGRKILLNIKEKSAVYYQDPNLITENDYNLLVDCFISKFDMSHYNDLYSLLNLCRICEKATYLIMEHRVIVLIGTLSGLTYCSALLQQHQFTKFVEVSVDKLKQKLQVRDFLIAVRTFSQKTFLGLAYDALRSKTVWGMIISGSFVLYSDSKMVTTISTKAYDAASAIASKLYPPQKPLTPSQEAGIYGVLGEHVDVFFFSVSKKVSYLSSKYISEVLDSFIAGGTQPNRVNTIYQIATNLLGNNSELAKNIRDSLNNFVRNDLEKMNNICNANNEDKSPNKDN